MLHMKWTCIDCGQEFNKRDRMLHERDTDHIFEERGKIVKPEPHNLLTETADYLNEHPPKSHKTDQFNWDYPETKKLFGFIRRHHADERDETK